MNKAYTQINWENYPSENTPLNEDNLNKMSAGLSIVDDRVISMDSSKADKSTVNNMIADVGFNESTGIFTFTRQNGATFTLDTKLEKMIVNFKYNYSTQTLDITLIDGTVQSIDMSTLVMQYEFLESDTIVFELSTSGGITAIVKDGSITEDKLQPNYLADIKVEVANAQNSATAAATSATIATTKASEASTSASNAKASETNAKTSETNASSSASKAKTSETNAKTSEENAKSSEENAATSESNAKTYASNASTSASTASSKASAASTSASTASSKATAAATSATNAADSEANAKYYYEQTKAIAIGDTAESTVTFTSGDSVGVSDWTSVDVMSSGEKHSSLFNKISTMFKNIRYLYKILGSTDISSIGDGTATGAISFFKDSILSTVSECSASTTATDIAGASAISEINSKLNTVGTLSVTSDYATLSSSNVVRIGRLCSIYLRMQTTTEIPKWGVICRGIPAIQGGQIPIFVRDNSHKLYNAVLGSNSIANVGDDIIPANTQIDMFATYISV